MVVTKAGGLVPVERVRCLECGITYVKPCGGSTIRRNPGCPRCGYVGWAPVNALTEDERRAMRARPLERRRLRLA